MISYINFFDLLKNTFYNSYGVKLGLLECIFNDGEQTKTADKLIGQLYREKTNS